MRKINNDQRKLMVSMLESLVTKAEMRYREGIESARRSLEDKHINSEQADLLWNKYDKHKYLMEEAENDLASKGYSISGYDNRNSTGYGNGKDNRKLTICSCGPIRKEIEKILDPAMTKLKELEDKLAYFTTSIVMAETTEEVKGITEEAKGLTDNNEIVKFWQDHVHV